jgi:phage-related protein
MPVIGPRCHELRIQDEKQTWRIIYRVDTDAVVIAEVFAKTTQTTTFGGDQEQPAATERV